MNKPFVSEDFNPPKKYEFANYYLEPITTKHVIEDWNILLSNADMVAQQRGAGKKDEWPYVCSLEEDYKDLAWLEVCAGYKQLFSYILRSNQDDRYLGCIYIYPIELFYADKADEYDVDFSFWITKDLYSRGKYEDVFKELLDWLAKDWPFKKERIYLRNIEIPESLR